jgi:hypothetical protein
VLVVPPPPPVINGACGPADNATLSTAPTSGLCSAGAATAVTGTGPWNWGCLGQGGGTNAICQALVGIPLPPPTGILLAPQIIQPSLAGDIVGVRVDGAAGYVTFGQVFKAGAVQPADSLVARISGVNALVQMDVKATHADGSVRHAVITFKVPAVPADVMLAKGSTPAPSPVAPTPAALVASAYDVSTALSFTAPAAASATVSASSLLGGPGNPQPWLAGPLVNEWRVTAPVNNGLLKVSFDVRAYADGTTHTDVVYGNDWFFTPGKADLTYGVTISAKGSQVFDAAGVYQYLYSMWHHEVDSTPVPSVQYDVKYLSAAGAIQNYDLSLGVTAAAIAADLSTLTAVKTAPMGTGNVTTYMPETGGRPDIGPQPTWTARWIVSQDATARQVMMVNADASGSVPWHYTDENTGQPLSRVTYPKFMDLAGQDPAYWNPVPVNGWPHEGSATDPWSKDNAHVPDLTYVPYLITGGHYRLDVFKHQSNYAITSGNPAYAFNGCDGNVVDPANPGTNLPMGIFCGQLRGMAWGLRNLSEAAYLVPDADSTKSYFINQLSLSMNGEVQWFLTGDANAKYGQIKGFLESPQVGWPIVAPWQEGYLSTSMVGLASMGMSQVSAQAVQLLGYATNFIAGLYTNGSNGYNPFNGPSYWLYVNDPTTGAPYTSWAQLQTQNVVDYTLNTSGWGLPTANPASFPQNAMDMDSGYAIIARAALAGIIRYAPSAPAQQGFDYLVTQINQKWLDIGGDQTAAWQADPTWLIVP